MNANAFKDLLVSSLGYQQNHILHINGAGGATDVDRTLTKDEDLKEALEDISQLSDQDDTVMIFIAGHGSSTSANIDMNNNEVCGDTDDLSGSDLKGWLTFTHQSNTYTTIKSKAQIFMLHSCYAGKFEEYLTGATSGCTEERAVFYASDSTHTQDTSNTDFVEREQSGQYKWYDINQLWEDVELSEFTNGLILAFGDFDADGNGDGILDADDNEGECRKSRGSDEQIYEIFNVYDSTRLPNSDGKISIQEWYNFLLDFHTTRHGTVDLSSKNMVPSNVYVAYS